MELHRFRTSSNLYKRFKLKRTHNLLLRWICKALLRILNKFSNSLQMLNREEERCLLSRFRKNSSSLLKKRLIMDHRMDKLRWLKGKITIGWPRFSQTSLKYKVLICRSHSRFSNKGQKKPTGRIINPRNKFSEPKNPKDLSLSAFHI